MKKKLKDMHPIACLVGSTNPEWKARYRFVEEILTKNGIVVISVVWFKNELANFESHRDLLESIHFQKMRMADFVVLIHSEARGKHTSLELEYARRKKIPITNFKTIFHIREFLNITFNWRPNLVLE